jgi:hypothetical protein
MPVTTGVSSVVRREKALLILKEFWIKLEVCY